MVFIPEPLERVWNTFIDWDVFQAVFPKLLTQGVPNTILLTIYSSLIGTTVGLLLAVAMMSTKRIWSTPSSWYVNIMRALPGMLSIYVIGQGLPLAGIRIFGSSTYGYAALGVGLMEAAYLAEVFRSGMQSVDRVYVESAIAQGLRRRTIFTKVILPIGIRRVIPALTNQYILIIKATSMVYLLGLSIEQRDLFSMAKDEVAIRGTLAPLVAAGVLYLAITLPLTWLVNRFDRTQRSTSTEPSVSELLAEKVSV